MKLILLSLIYCFVVLISSVLCESDDDCPTELPKNIVDACNITASHVELANALLEYADQNITRDEFKQFNDDYCSRLTNYIKCVFENGLYEITEKCKSSQKYGLIHWHFKYQKIFSEYYCENDGARQMESIDDDGVSCLFGEDHINCLFDALDEVANICHLINGTISCEDHFDHCVNQNVKQYRSELFRILSNQFNCS